MITWQLKENTDIYLIVSKNIRYYRKLRRITQKELARRTGYSCAFIRRIEAPNCPKNFSIQTIYLISRALNIDIKYFFE